jgi:hypothetical protein
MTAEGSVYQRKDGRWVAQYQDLKGKRPATCTA